MKNFLLPAYFSKPQNQKYQLENPVQFGRRAKRGGPQIVDFSLLAPYTEISSNIFRRLRRRGKALVIAARPQSGLAAFFKNCQRTEKYRPEPHFVKENFS